MKVPCSRTVSRGGRNPATNSGVLTLVANLYQVAPLAVHASHSGGIPGAQAEVIVDGESFLHDLSPSNANRVCRLDEPVSYNQYQMGTTNSGRGGLQLTGDRFGGPAQRYIQSLERQQRDTSRAVIRRPEYTRDTDVVTAQHGKLPAAPDPSEAFGFPAQYNLKIPYVLDSNDYVQALIRSSDKKVVSLIGLTEKQAVMAMGIAALKSRPVDTAVDTHHQGSSSRVSTAKRNNRRSKSTSDEHSRPTGLEVNKKSFKGNSRDSASCSQLSSNCNEVGEVSRSSGATSINKLADLLEASLLKGQSKPNSEPAKVAEDESNRKLEEKQPST